MDKIDRKKYRMYLMTAPLVVDMIDKLDELIEGYNELHKIVMRLDRIRQVNNKEATEEMIKMAKKRSEK